ncbi:polysaccharide deacetylase [Arcicella aurantiaca]|uniref:Polysaccharide deacetylase n=1 Tax=Arcicella aurantiaca TaxID=591202 RepID=A0A316EEC9_9BACT|nr:polysaccharide deacetylase family protein [Arcicella aurantiaca]PWK28551.1 polysaccharide deacetylase [Arcicella aurantiaca]
MNKLLCYFILMLLGVSCNSRKPIQQGGIALSFDDRFVKEWTDLKPLLNKYNVKATFYVTQPDSLSEEEVQILHELRKDGHEIGCHGAMHVRSMYYIWDNSLEKYMENEIFHALKTMKKQGFTPKTFAHPGGSQTWYSDRELLKYFTLLRDVSMKSRSILGFDYIRDLENMDEIYHQRDNAQKVNALLIDISGKLTIEDIKKGLERTSKEGSVMMMFGHKPLTKTTQNLNEYGFDVQFLEQILAESAKLNLKSYTMQEL